VDLERQHKRDHIDSIALLISEKLVNFHVCSVAVAEHRQSDL
jgi:hypothetical protein